MKFALDNDNKVEATKGAKGLCPICGSELIAKCGEVIVNHWSHKGNRNCDLWWENETEWHRSWEDQFPIDWQEVVHFDESGEKHIADVKTQTGWTLEFQHSYLNPEERRSRNAFYSNLVWVVDGARRKTDKSQFKKTIEESSIVCKEPRIRRVHFPDECRLLKEWNGSNALVFFDFQEANETKQSKLYFLYPTTSTTEAHLSTFSREDFIDLHNNNKFDEIVKNKILPICEILASNQKNRHEYNVYSRTNRLSGLDRYMANKQRRRKRF